MLFIGSHMGRDPKMAQKFDLIETKVVIIIFITIIIIIIIIIMYWTTLDIYLCMFILYLQYICNLILLNVIFINTYNIK